MIGFWNPTINYVDTVLVGLSLAFFIFQVYVLGVGHLLLGDYYMGYFFCTLLSFLLLYGCTGQLDLVLFMSKYNILEVRAERNLKLGKTTFFVLFSINGCRCPSNRLPRSDHIAYHYLESLVPAPHSTQYSYRYNLAQLVSYPHSAPPVAKTAPC